MKIVCFLIGVFFSFHTVFACEVIDDSGQKINLSHPAKRIISLAPDLTEILFVTGIGNHVIGVMKGSDYPAEAKNILQVANYNSVDSEKILSLHPDLIVTWSDVSFSQQLKKFNIPVYVSRPQKLLDIPQTMLRLGCLAGKEVSAKQSAIAFIEKYQKLRKHYAKKRKLTVFYQVWSRPLITVTKKSWINEVISLCGGENIFANLKGVSPEVNIETVMVADPDVIVGSDVNVWQHSSRMSAVKNHHLLILNSDLIDRAGPRVLEGVEEMCQKLDEVRNDSI